MSGGGGNTTQVTSSEPWGGAEKFAEKFVGEGGWGQTLADQYYSPRTLGDLQANKNIGSVVYPDQRVASQSQNTTDAQNATVATAIKATPYINEAFQRALGWAGGTKTDEVGQLVSNAYTQALEPTISGSRADTSWSGSQDAMTGLSPLNKGDYFQSAVEFAKPAMEGMSPISTGAYTSSIAENVGDMWNKVQAPTAYGDMLNPNLNTALAQYAQSAIDPMRQEYLNTIIPTTRTALNAAGRGGSDTAALLEAQNNQNYMRQVGNTMASIYAPAYETERNRQMKAAGLPAEMINPMIQQQLQGAQMGQNLVQNVLGQQVQAAGIPGDMYKYLNQAQLAATAPVLDTYKTALNQETQGSTDMSNLLNQYMKGVGNVAAVGESQDAYNQALINAEMQKYQENLWTPLDITNALSNLAFTGGSLGRTQSTQTTSPQSGLASQLLGAGAAVASNSDSISNLLGHLGG